METASKPLLRGTDRLRQTLAALARLLDQTLNDIQVLDSEFQERIHQTAHDTQISVEQQAAERLRLAIDKAERETRAIVTDELQAHYNEEMEAAVEIVRNELTAERERFNQEMERMQQAASDWETERAQLVADCQRASELLEQTKQEHDRALAETDEAAAIALERQIATAVERVRAELTARWEPERAKLVSERDRISTAYAELERSARENLERQLAVAREKTEAEREKLIAENERARKHFAEAVSDHDREMTAVVERVREELTDEGDRLRKELEQGRHAFQELESERDHLLEECEKMRRLLSEAKPAKQAKGVPGGTAGGSAVNVDGLIGEIARVEGVIHEISRIIEDPDTELSLVIRKNAERAELESYLRGIRFAIPGKS